MSRFSLDIETNQLLAKMLDYTSLPYKLRGDARLWTVCLRNIDTNEEFGAENENITKEWLKGVLKDCTTLITLNGMKFDLIALKLFGVLEYDINEGTVFGNKCEIIDVLIWSRLFNPERYGGHSLKAWGERLGEFKDDYRQKCIEAGYIAPNAPKGEEFSRWTPLLKSYCFQDCKVTQLVYLELFKEYAGYPRWKNASIMEHKLADIGIQRETFGFAFDKEKAIKCVEDLTQKMEELTNKVNPLLPSREMNKGELEEWTPPKNQLKKDNTPTAALLRFCDKHNLQLHTPLEGNRGYYIEYKGRRYNIPIQEPLETETIGTIDNLDHVKMHLINLGWCPSEWRMRDLTKDSKKKNLSYPKRIKAMEKWLMETINGKYTKERREIVEIPFDEIFDVLSEKLKDNKPVYVPTSPMVRVGVEKNLCPNLIKLGEKVAFAADFANYLTYKHRKNSIAGGLNEDEEYDLEEDIPNSGYLKLYREEDGRIPTAAIEIGAVSNRMRHIGVVNVARATSIYGAEMRSLFGSGKNGYQLGYDYSSLEARLEAALVYKYPGGEKLAEMLIASKPLDLHSISAERFGIPRSDAKSVNYAIIYSAQPPKIAKMLGCSLDRAKEIYNEFWSINSALSDLKQALEKHWYNNNKKYIVTIDGRKIMTRSKHSILNALLQSAGALCQKYATIFIYEKLHKLGVKTNPFEYEPEFCEMISMHDESQYFIDKKFFKYNTFKTEVEAENFVKNWNGNQLSTIKESKSGGYYISLPNIVSEAIEEAVERVNKMFKFPITLGFEWSVGRSWLDCH